MPAVAVPAGVTATRTDGLSSGLMAATTGILLPVMGSMQSVSEAASAAKETISTAGQTLTNRYVDGPHIRLISVLTQSGRPEHLQELNDILKDKLTTEERKLIPLDTTASPLQLGKATLAEIRDLNRNNGSTSNIVQGLERIACIGDVAIQHSPEVTALVWAGIRVFLQVSYS